MEEISRTLPPITAKELIALQEFVTIPTYLIEELKDKPYSKLGAYIDFLSMADENGEILVAQRTLMERWKWGNTRVRNFIDYLIDKDICKPKTNHETNQKQTRVFIVNSEFLALPQTKNKPQNKPKTNQEKAEDADCLKAILDAWNELSEYGIEPIPEMGISSVQYQNLKSIVGKYGIEDVASTIQRIKISDFLQGRVTEWKITFNWFLKDGNYQKVRSGKYDGGNSISKKAERSGSSEQAEDEELIGDEWVDL